MDSSYISHVKHSYLPLDEMRIDSNGNLVYAPKREKLIEVAEKRFEGNDEIKKFLEKATEIL